MTDEYGMKREPRPCLRPPPKPERTGVRPKHVYAVVHLLIVVVVLSALVYFGGWQGLAMLGCGVVFAAAWVAFEHWASGDRWPWERKQ